MPIKEIVNRAVKTNNLGNVLKEGEDKDIGGNDVVEKTCVQALPSEGGISSFLENFVPLFPNAARTK